jgi:hypothetical protein
MFVFFGAGDDSDIEPNSTLDAGEEIELEFEYHADAVGRATIKLPRRRQARCRGPVPPQWRDQREPGRPRHSLTRTFTG